MSAIFGNEKLFACGAKVGQSQELLRKMKKNCAHRRKVIQLKSMA